MTTRVDSDAVGEVLAALGTDEGRADPYPHYARLRALGPVVTAPDGVLVITGYRQCSAFVRDQRPLKQSEQLLLAAGYHDWRERPSLRLMFTSMVMLDGPAHTRLRRLVSSAFTARRVANLRPAVERIVGELCERLDGTTDFVTEFAFPLPATVIGELLGVPRADRPMFQTLVRDWTMVLDELSPAVVDRADSAAVTIRDYLADLAETRHAEPADDLISALVAAGDGEEGLDAEELVSMAALLLSAGFETTTGLLANGLFALLEEPAQAARLRTEQALAAPAVEELLRYDSPVHLASTRIMPTDLTIADIGFAEGQRAVALLGAANRDPEVFREPDRLVLDRAEEPPLSFGGGAHYCLGAPLARLEAQVAFPLLLSRFPRLSLAGDPVFRPGLSLHTYTSLPISTN
ncbi:cytochrome P450 [Amycolatopsis sp. CA-230715]|uniref:cytochrome P450 n=1 Tax=Amycolatopsis sp. CA-230715 TaxID=2745196 RepID=UPI001C03230D|nr:cytochrome P450 [Amycolatopsis sp. CA-230715]QWF84016.1 Polyketide biosynthesis cytochrome P450 PksS [Amycolatopsis sp. CA-230715]